MQELASAEQSFADVCDQIAKAERFFPVPGIGHGEHTARDSAADGACTHSSQPNAVYAHCVKYLHGTLKVFRPYCMPARVGDI